MAVLSNPPRPAGDVFYSVAGRSISLEGSGAHASEPFRKFFSGWHVEPLPPALRPEPDAVIRVLGGEPAPTLTHEREVFEIAAGGRCVSDGVTSQQELGDSVVRFVEGKPALVEVYLAALGGRDAREVARVVFQAAAGAFRRCGLFELHGGAVVEPGGAGVLILGPSGAGKSTLTLQLAAAGWRYLSDDALLLYEAEGGAEVRGLRRAFAVTQTTIEAAAPLRLEQVAAAPLAFDPAKRRFDPAEVFPKGFAESCRPRAIFFPRVAGGGASETRRLSRAEAMSLLLRQCPWACYDRVVAREHLRALGALVNQSAAFELAAGEDLMGDPKLTADFVASRLRGSE